MGELTGRQVLLVLGTATGGVGQHARGSLLRVVEQSQPGGRVIVVGGSLFAQKLRLKRPGIETKLSQSARRFSTRNV